MTRLLLVLVVLNVGAVAQARPKIAVIPTQFDETSRGELPKLFDDYLLGAVQNAGDFEVIGQDDISTLLGFEKEKELMGCDDATCLADIGGALGVERIVSVKVARLGGDWVATGKLINIRSTRVEARVNEIVPGSAKDLLTGVHRLVSKLFGSAAPASKEGSSAPASAAPAPWAPTTAAPYDESLGRGSRVTGLILMGAGLLGYIATASFSASANCFSTEDYFGYDAGTYCDATYMYAFATQGLTFLASALGSGLYLNGKAQRITHDGEASGRVWWRVFGYLLMGGSVSMYLGAAALESEGLGSFGAVLGGLGLGVFGLSMFLPTGKASLSNGTTVPLYASVAPTVTRDVRGGAAPGVSFALAF